MTANAPEQPKPIDKDSAEKLAKILGQMGATEEGQRGSAAARAAELLKRRPDIAQDIAANLSRFTGGEGQPSYDELERTLNDAVNANEAFAANEKALHKDRERAWQEVERLRNKYEAPKPRRKEPDLEDYIGHGLEWRNGAVRPVVAQAGAESADGESLRLGRDFSIAAAGLAATKICDLMFNPAGGSMLAMPGWESFLAGTIFTSAMTKIVYSARDEWEEGNGINGDLWMTKAMSGFLAGAATFLGAIGYTAWLTHQQGAGVLETIAKTVILGGSLGLGGGAIGAAATYNLVGPALYATVSPFVRLANRAFSGGGNDERNNPQPPRQPAAPAP